MTETRSLTDLEARLSQAAHSFPYPATPDMSRPVLRRMAAARPATTRRRLALAGLALLVLLAALLSFQPVRAAVLDWIRIGAVRIFLVRPTSLPAATFPPGTPAPIPSSSPTLLHSVLDLSGETSLADAQAMAGFSLRLPSAEPPPDRVFYQDLGSPVIILVWLDPAQPARVRLALSETASDGAIFQKIQPTSVVDTRVGGQAALWVEAPYLLITGSGDVTITRLVAASHTLIWTDGQMTFRQETARDLPAAVRLAESLR